MGIARAWLAAASAVIAAWPFAFAAAQASSAADFDFASAKEIYRRPSARPVENAALVELGGRLFWDRRLSEGDVRRLPRGLAFHGRRFS